MVCWATNADYTTDEGASMLKTHTCGELSLDNVGQEVTLAGWVNRRRDHGGLIFIDLRDRFGVTQVTVDSDAATQCSRQSPTRFAMSM